MVIQSSDDADYDDGFNGDSDADTAHQRGNQVTTTQESNSARNSEEVHHNSTSSTKSRKTVRMA